MSSWCVLLWFLSCLGACHLPQVSRSGEREVAWSYVNWEGWFGISLLHCYSRCYRLKPRGKERESSSATPLPSLFFLPLIVAERLLWEERVGHSSSSSPGSLFASHLAVVVERHAAAARKYSVHAYRPHVILVISSLDCQHNPTMRSTVGIEFQGSVFCVVVG